MLRKQYLLPKSEGALSTRWVPWVSQPFVLGDRRDSLASWLCVRYRTPPPPRVSGVGTCRAGIRVSDPLSRVALSSFLLVKWMLLGPLATTVSSLAAADSHLPCFFFS